MPAVSSLSTAGNMWFSFNYSNVHFVSISTETDYPYSPEGRGTFWNAGPFGPQLEWLEADLANANLDRDAHPWVVVVGHRPLYSSSNSDFPPGIRERLREAVEDLFNKYSVDLYICGHIHSYERIWPVYKSVVTQKNYTKPTTPTYLVIGNAGNIEGHSGAWVKPTPDWLAFRNENDYGYGLLTFKDDHSVHFEMRRAVDNSLADQFDLTK